jgi:hypothetical protein
MSPKDGPSVVIFCLSSHERDGPNVPLFNS